MHRPFTITQTMWSQLERKVQKIMSGLTDLQTAVAAMQTAVAAAVADIQSLSTQLSGIESEDPQVETIAQSLNQTAATLQAAVTPPAKPAA